MTREEFIEQHCRFCGSQRCYGEEYCVLYQEEVLGQKKEKFIKTPNNSFAKLANEFEKNITEMATAMCKNYGGCNQCMFYPSCDVRSHALRVYDAGWRQQIEAEWVPITTINKKFGVPVIVGFNCSNCQIKQEVPTNYCSFCGAKMEQKG